MVIIGFFLFQILGDMNKLDERITSLDVVQQVAERANAGTVFASIVGAPPERARLQIP